MFCRYRYRFGHFINRLGIEYNCTQKAVTGIVAEMTQLWSLGFELFQQNESGKFDKTVDHVRAKKFLIPLFTVNFSSLQKTVIHFTILATD